MIEDAIGDAVGDATGAAPAVDRVLHALAHDPDAPAVLAAFDQAAAAVADMDRGLAERALRLLLAEVDECRRAGLAGSPALDRVLRTAAVALLLERHTGR